MSSSPPTAADIYSSPIRPVKKSTGRQLVVLAVATVALIGFILVMGDIRRKSAALTRAQSYAAELSGRMGESRTLPLELTSRRTPNIPSQTFRFESLSRDEAFRLRETVAPVMVAWTGSIRGDVLRPGRVVIFFEEQSFAARWLEEADFADRLARQNVSLRGLASDQ